MKNKNAANAIAVLIPYLRAAAFIVLVIMLEIVHAKAWSYDENGIAEDQFRLIEQSKQTRSEEKLIIGDSVASQLFGNDKRFQNAYTMTGNCSATMGGYYLLLRNYIEANPQTKRIIMVISPDLMANAADKDYSYQYYVVPYYTQENMQYITEDVQEYIDYKYGAAATRCDPLKKIIYNDMFVLSQYRDYITATRPKERENMRISALSATYLRQIKQLCDDNSINLKVMCCPLQSNRIMRTWKGFEEDIERYGLQDILNGYSKNATYYDEKNFQDEYHFKDSFLKKGRPVILKNLLERNGE